MRARNARHRYRPTTRRTTELKSMTLNLTLYSLSVGLLYGRSPVKLKFLNTEALSCGVWARKFVPTYHPAHLLHSAAGGEIKGYWNRQVMIFDFKRAYAESCHPQLELT